MPRLQEGSLMARRRLNAAEVGWHAPETLRQTELAARLADVTSEGDALAILNERPTVGEFRILVNQSALQEGPGGTTVFGPEWGDRAVWVDEEPDNREDAPGHFEIYDAERHGEPYNPIFRQGA